MEGWVAILGAVGTFVSVVLLAVSAALMSRQQRQKVKMDAAEARLFRQIDRLDKHVSRQQEVIDQLTEEHTTCQAQLARMYAWLLRFRDAAERLCRDAGRDPAKELPEMPPPPPEPTGAAEFRSRTAKHNTGLVRGTLGPQAEADPDEASPS